MEKPIKEFAILYAQEARLWEICNIAGWPDALRRLYHEHGDKVKMMAEANWPNKIGISGYHPEVDHYSIDKAIEKRFNKEIASPDSESGQFFCYTTDKYLHDVILFLEDRFPGWKNLEYYETDRSMTPFANWTEAKHYCKENHIDIPPLDEHLQKIVERIEYYDEQIAQLKREQKKYLDELDS